MICTKVVNVTIPVEISYAKSAPERGARENGIPIEPDYPGDVDVDSVTIITDDADINDLLLENLDYEAL